MKGLELSKKKTVFAVFRKLVKLRKDYQFRYKGDFVEIEKEFVCLGVKFFEIVSMHRRLSMEYKRYMCMNLILKSEVGKIRDLSH